jgi:transcriptional regulator GlxA family with amidase domain
MNTPPNGKPKIPWLKLAPLAKYRAAALGRVPGWLMHPRTVRRHIRKEFGTTPQRWLDKLRMKEARGLLRLGERTKEIARQLGYQTASHFCRHFKQRHRFTPQEWMRRLSKLRPV